MRGEEGDPFAIGDTYQKKFDRKAAMIEARKRLDYQDNQKRLIHQMEQQASGEAPSAAEMQMRQGIDSSVAASLAASRSARGGNVGAQRAAQQAQANQMNVKGAGMMAQVRAQEQARAQQLLGQTISAAQSARLAQTGQNDAMVQYYTSLGLSADESDRRAEMDRLGYAQAQDLGEKGYEVQREAAQYQLVGSLAGSAGEGMSQYQSGSDENFKTNVDKSGKALEGMLDKLVAATWDYKDQDKHGKGGHVGVMAQDLEKSELGKTMVIEGDDGKYVDLKKLTTAALAAAVHTHKRLKKLEGKK